MNHLFIFKTDVHVRSGIFHSLVQFIAFHRKKNYFCTPSKVIFSLIRTISIWFLYIYVIFIKKNWSDVSTRGQMSVWISDFKLKSINKELVYCVFIDEFNSFKYLQGFSENDFMQNIKKHQLDTAVTFHNSTIINFSEIIHLIAKTDWYKSTNQKNYNQFEIYFKAEKTCAVHFTKN